MANAITKAQQQVDLPHLTLIREGGEVKRREGLGELFNYYHRTAA
jgi:hypothetical protein